MKAVDFVTFCHTILGLTLTPAQRVLARVCFDGIEPANLPEDEKATAATLFGDLRRIPSTARRILVLVLGRNSGKTTLSSAYALYTMLTGSVRGCGPGDVPTVVVVAPDRKTATLSVRMALEMAKRNPDIAKRIEKESTAQWDAGFTVRRPDGRLAAYEVFAANRGGASVRGRSVMAFILDEAWFFRSDPMSTVNDRDVYRALIPRLLRGGRGVFISTPWPVETLMGELVEKNWTTPQTALVAKAPTSVIRAGDPDIEDIVAAERLRDPENAAREFDCDITAGSGTGGYFDLGAIQQAAVGEIPAKTMPHWQYAAGADFAFRSDSSTIVICAFDGNFVRVVDSLEMRPTRKEPLRPSVVVERFAAMAKKYGVSHVVTDGHYREAIVEHLQAHGLAVIDAPAGLTGKIESFARARAVLHEGKAILPRDTRLALQLASVVSKPLPGGSVSITIPRKAGLGHGDIVSAWVLAVHRLTHARASAPAEGPPQYGTREFEIHEWNKEKPKWEKRMRDRYAPAAETGWLDD